MSPLRVHRDATDMAGIALTTTSRDGDRDIALDVADATGRLSWISPPDGTSGLSSLWTSPWLRDYGFRSPCLRDDATAASSHHDAIVIDRNVAPPHHDIQRDDRPVAETPSAMTHSPSRRRARDVQRDPVASRRCPARPLRRVPDEDVPRDVAIPSRRRRRVGDIQAR